MMPKTMLTPQRLRELFSYDEKTGKFTRVKAIRGVKRGAQVVGCKNQHGHLRMTVDGSRYQAHRLVWLYVHGRWPDYEIDHLNGIPDDNRIDNLRDVPHWVNVENVRKPKGETHSGRLGVAKNGNCWQARIKSRGVFEHIGSFSDRDEAHKAYVMRKRQLHAGCTI